MNMKPMRTIVHLPLTLNGKFVKYKQIATLEFIDVSVGDEFIITKRPDLNVSFDNIKKTKVAASYMSTVDRGNLVVLEPKDFKDIKLLNKY